jgi:hypothetical protein
MALRMVILSLKPRGAEIPNPKHQMPNKSKWEESQKLKTMGGIVKFVLNFGFLCHLEFVCDLVLGIFDFPASGP